MSAATCARIREAEALEDGRLGRDEPANFLEHAQQCEVCATELRALGVLRDKMRGLPPLEASPVQARRSRAQLLRRFDEARGARAAAGGRRHAYLMFAAAVVAIAAFFVERNFVRAPVVAPTALTTTASEPPTFDVANIDGAVFETKVEGTTARSSLSRGSAAFHVQRLNAGQRFLLALPDGEIEVRGTRFAVSLDGGKTRSVDVSEGVVVLRLHDRAETVLQAGQGWSLPAAPSASAPPLVQAPPTPPSVRTREKAVTSTAEPSASDAPSKRFVAAADAFQSGSYAQADALLAAFQRDFPGDARAEDAAFLRLMAHDRMGDRAGAAALARAYLRAFPSGLRRREAEQLAGER